MTEIPKFDMSSMKPLSSIFVIGTRDTGKSTLVKDIMFHQRNVFFHGQIVCEKKKYKNYVPETRIHCTYRNEMVKIEVKSQIKRLNSKVTDNKTFFIFDNCLDESWNRNKLMQYILWCGRRWKCMLLITASNFPINNLMLPDYFFLFQNNDKKDNTSFLRNIYVKIAKHITDFDTFCHLFRNLKQYECLVTNCTENTIYLYKAEFHEPYMIGAYDYMKIKKKMDVIREDLMRSAFHPKRLIIHLDMGGDTDDF